MIPSPHLLLGNLRGVNGSEELHDLVEDHLGDEVDLRLGHWDGLVRGRLSSSRSEPMR
jgi:hypothetical protein